MTAGEKARVCCHDPVINDFSILRTSSGLSGAPGRRMELLLSHIYRYDMRSARTEMDRAAARTAPCSSGRVAPEKGHARRARHVLFEHLLPLSTAAVGHRPA